MASRLTELEAVNLILASSDMMPVTTIAAGTTAEATLAVQQLDTCHREVLNEGWHWNTEYEVSLEAAELTNKVAIPTTMLRFDPREVPYYIARGRFIYDRLNKTEAIGEAVKGTAIYFIEWDDLLEEVKMYITKKAARRFHQYHVGTDDSLQSLIMDEREARRLILDGDLDAGAYSMFDSPDMHAGLSGGSVYTGSAAFFGNDPFKSRDSS